MPFGVMGGHYQPMGHSWFLTNLLEYGLDIQEAIDLPRLLPLGGKLQIERGIPQDVVDRCAHGPRARTGRASARRRPGDLDRPRPRLPDRRVGAAQGRAGAGILTVGY